jgi:PAS domain S-box-containing protein
MLGYAPGTLAGGSLLDLVHADDQDRLRELIVTPRARSGYPPQASLRFRHADGTWRHIALHVAWLADSRATRAILVVGRDVTEQHILWQALGERQARPRVIVEESPFGMALIDPQGQVLWSNPAMARILDRDTAAWRQWLLKAAAEHDTWRSGMDLYTFVSTSAHDYARVEHQFDRTDGSIGWARVTLSHVRDANRRPPSVLAILEDISPRKRIDAELAEARHSLIAAREAERLHLAQELHDGPIQDLFGICYHLDSLGDTVTAAQLAPVQGSIYQVAAALRTLCVELRPPMLAPFGLEMAIRSHSAHFQRDHPELEMTLQLESDHQALPSDVRLALFRIYQEALRNVALHAGAHRVEVRLTLSATSVVLEITDDGHGVDLPKRWIDLARGGHLGLLGAAERVEALNGRLEVESAAGQGLLLRAIMPRPQAPAEQAPASGTGRDRRRVDRSRASRLLARPRAIKPRKLDLDRAP